MLGRSRRVKLCSSGWPRRLLLPIRCRLQERPCSRDYFQICVTHPLFEESLENFGSRPAWDLAIAKVKEQRWRHQWANQLGNDALDFLPRVLDIARSQLPGSTNQSGQSLVEHKQAAYSKWLEVVQGLASSTGRDWS